ncbi:MAG: MoaD/ThiS family protein [Candidatus Bathyarchaeia archaeon]
MIKVTLIILDESLRKIISEKEIKVELSEDKATIEGLISDVAMKYGGFILEVLSKPAKNSILLNGQDIEFLGYFNAKLSDGDRVAIIPLVSGG